MNAESMDVIEKIKAARLRKSSLIEQYVKVDKISSEISGLATYNPDSARFMGIEYTPAQIRNHWETRIITPLGFKFTLNNISNFLKGQKRECLDQIRFLLNN